MGLFSSGIEALREIRESGFTGPVNEHGEALMSRTDAKTGRALFLTDKGSNGHGTPDEDRARGLSGRGR